MRYNVIREYLQKLKNKKGSALLVSLLFSIISIIIATVILNAAVTSSRRVTETAESSQPYYLVSSLFSVFEYEASSGGGNPPDRGMEVTADLTLDTGGTDVINDSIAKNAPFNPSDPPSDFLNALENDTNLNTLQRQFAFCLTKAMLTDTPAFREFKVSVGIDNTVGFAEQYVLTCKMSVNPIDYTAQIAVTEILDVNGSVNLNLPEICTLVLPTERVEILKMEPVGGIKRPTKIRFIYQKAKYISSKN